MPSILDQILAADRRRTATVGPFPLQGADATRLKEARDRVDQARKAAERVRSMSLDTDRVDDAEAVLTAAEEALDALLEECPTFLVNVQEVLPPERVEQLIAKHPPTADQRKAAKAEGTTRLLFNAETFPPAFLSLAIVDIEMGGEHETVDEVGVKQLWDALSEPDRNLLFGAAWMLRVAPTMIGSLGKD